MSHEQVDTRVTAYVFGELSPDAAAQFEREMEKSNRLQEEVAATRETVTALKSEFCSQATGVSERHREVIERAIEQRSQSPVAASSSPVAASSSPVAASSSPVAAASSSSDPTTRSRPPQTSYRRLLVGAALAASALIVIGLNYPHLLGRHAVVTVNESAQPVIGATGQHENVGQQTLSSLLASFNELIEQRRYDEADLVAQQVRQLDPDHPIGITLLNTSRLGRRVADGNPELPITVTTPLAPAPAEADAGTLPPSLPDLALAPLPTTSPPPTTVSKQPGESHGEAADRLADNLSPPVDQSAPALSNLAAIANQELKRTSDPEVDDETRSKSLPSAAEDLAAQPAKSAASQSIGDGQSLPAARFSRVADADADGSEIVEFDMPNIDDIGLLGQPRRSRRNVDPAADADREVSMEMMMERQTDAEKMELEMMMGMGLGSELPAHGDRFESIEDNAFVNVSHSPLSTFSIDVDTASYAKVRALLNQNRLPPPGAVRIEELLNYFDYDYPAPQTEHPFAASMEIAACPWNPKHRLARIGIKGKEIQAQRPSSNLVFLLDVSGSMDEPEKLPLVIDGMKMLTHQLTENDKVAIVVYAGAAGLILDATRGDRKRQIVDALDELKAGGSTNGGQGIVLAYQLARDNFIVGGTNRVILCTDGDFNVGVTDDDQLVKIAQDNAKSNIFLSVLGFGTGNHNDSMMEQISNQGNGNYAFIDSKSEAKKVLVEELGSTLFTIAKDVKIQVEFNPRQVASYRLIGYENRMLAAEDFDNDEKDAGEIGAGHTVTALYELVPADPDDADVPRGDELRYQEPVQLSQQADSGETLVLKLRYKQPDGDVSTLIEIPVADEGKRFSQTDRDFKFAASVAAFGMLLRDSPHKGSATFARVHRIARDGAKGDDFGFRTEFVDLVARAKQLRGE